LNAKEPGRGLKWFWGPGWWKTPSHPRLGWKIRKRGGVCACDQGSGCRGGMLGVVLLGNDDDSPIPLAEKKEGQKEENNHQSGTQRPLHTSSTTNKNQRGGLAGWILPPVRGRELKEKNIVTLTVAVRPTGLQKKRQRGNRERVRSEGFYTLHSKGRGGGGG